MKKVDVLIGFLACPSDVSTYRDAAKNVFNDWNLHNGLDNNVFLQPINWADNSRPDTGDSPQELINKQLLGKCDFLIGIFWQGLGTPTVRAESGTVDEINNFIANGKTCMIYFSTQKKDLDLIDLEEYKRVKEFKNKISKNALFANVKSVNGFKNKLTKDLTALVYEYRQKSNSDGFHATTSNIEEDNASVNHLISRLSTEAKQLLSEACKDKNTFIMNQKYIGAQEISAGKFKVDLDYSETRKIVKWEEAIEQLLGAKLIKPYGSENGIYTPTSKGFEFGEKLPTDQINRL